MPNCSVFCCKKRSATSNLQKDGVTFHMFPKDPNLRNIWKTFSHNRPTWIPTRNSVICSNHFKTSDFQVLANNRRRLVDGAKPTANCICSNHRQSLNIPDERLSSNGPINDTRTIPNSLTSPCRSSTPQNTQSKETSKNLLQFPLLHLHQEKKMQQQLDCQKKKLKGYKLKIFS
ncbi:THAP domain-containing protein 1-like [Helicoverpa armigera]|uniref:THAP domain-containing protein 1-like n=1 Tax=Helicoverpa armigera TaxID=29058 RepID=UPI003083B29F